MDHILIFLRKYSEKKAKYTETKGWNNKYVNKLHKWGNRIIIFLIQWL